MPLLFHLPDKKSKSAIHKLSKCFIALLLIYSTAWSSDFSGPKKHFSPTSAQAKKPSPFNNSSKRSSPKEKKTSSPFKNSFKSSKHYNPPAKRDSPSFKK